MQKLFHNKQSLVRWILLSLTILVLSLVAFAPANVIRKSTVTYPSADSLMITADKYVLSIENPYIILLHEQNSSRGEFQDIAERLCKMDYNCLAVDLRNGGNANYISNETVKRCQENKCSTDYSDVLNDIVSSIEYAYKLSNKPVVLFGSGANGSLSLVLGKTNENVRAVAAFSPGEYFKPAIIIEDTITNLLKPVFIASSSAEYPYMEQLASGIEEDYKTVFNPQLGEGIRGTASLSKENENNSEYWLALLLFFKDLV